MKVKNFDELKNVGDWFFTEEHGMNDARRLSFLCPCGCGSLAGIRVRNDGVNDGKCWGWNKDEDKPTTAPSIDVIGHWHGYLTDDVFVKC